MSEREIVHSASLATQLPMPANVRVVASRKLYEQNRRRKKQVMVCLPPALHSPELYRLPDCIKCS